MARENPPAELASDRTLYLIDGHAQIFRAFFAIRSAMSSPVTGEPTNATFAFTGMLIKLFEQFQPQYVAMAIDSSGPTFREELYPEYKAQREAPPEEFGKQVPRILEISRLFGIPVIEKQGAEADDLIATIVQRILSDPQYDGIHIRVVSKDKDLEQLIGPRVTMFDIHTDTEIDADYLWEHRGVTPEQVVDLLTLTGDTVDNIPGVKGVGAKTAAKLLQEFASVQGVYENIEKIKGKRRENLEAAAGFLDTSRKLVTLNDEVEIDFDMEDARVGGVDAGSLRLMFKQLGFNRHQGGLEKLLEQGQALPGVGPAEQTGEREAGEGAGTLFDMGHEGRASVGVVDEGLTHAQDFEYEAITTAEQLDELVRTLGEQELIAVDAETVGLGHRKEICGLCFAWREGHGVYVPMCSPVETDHLDRETVLGKLRGLLEDERVRKTGHNLKYDYLVLRYAGVRMRGIAFDSMVGAYLLNAPGLGMDALALSMLGHETIPISQLIGPGGRGKTQKTMDQVPLEQITPYAAEDADLTLRLTHAMQPRLQADGMAELAERVEVPLVVVLAEMEHAGIRVDPQVLAGQRAELDQRIVELRDQIHEAAGRAFNIDSPKQLAEVLFTDLGLPVVKKTKTGASTDIEVLERLCEMDELGEEQCRVPRLMVEYRQLTKLVSTYLQSLGDAIDEQTGRIHATFHQTSTATGRLSSSDPNLQNIPVRTELGRQIRRAFVAEQGHQLICADYSQIELRLLAHLAEDEALIEAFNQDMDIHSAVAAQVFDVALDEVTPEQRGHAKTINFGIIYGVTPWGLARRIDSLNVTAAKQLIADYRGRFKGIDRFLQECVEYAREHGHVRTMLGRRRAIPQITSSNQQTQALGQRLAINTVVQGSAADLIKQAMVNLHQRIERESLPMKLLVQIHDELILESPEDQAQAMARVVEQEMEGAMALKVPLKAEAGLGQDWFNAK